jgi:hypothetical protein
MAQWREDPAGIWSRFFYKFPGTGRSYPLAPGKTAVVATDAIDHSAIVRTLPDLSRADFEFVGSSDVDNPDVPNMINVGPGEWADVLGHGLFFSSLSNTVFIADSVDTASLPRDFLPVNAPEYRRIPTGRILDVVTTTIVASQESVFGFPLCAGDVNALFDRQRAKLIDVEQPYSVVRKVASTLPSGRIVLQRTLTSSRDFTVQDPPTPGRVP